MTKRKPCPFCKSDCTLTWHLGHFTDPWIVECAICGAQGPRGHDEKEAIEKWNRRASA